MALSSSVTVLLIPCHRPDAAVARSQCHIFAESAPVEVAAALRGMLECVELLLLSAKLDYECHNYFSIAWIPRMVSEQRPCVCMLDRRCTGNKRWLCCELALSGERLNVHERMP